MTAARTMSGRRRGARSSSWNLKTRTMAAPAIPAAIPGAMSGRSDHMTRGHRKSPGRSRNSSSVACKDSSVLSVASCDLAQRQFPGDERADDKLNARVCAVLLLDRLDVLVNRLAADAELSPDLSVGLTHRHKHATLPLPWGQ